MASSAIFGGCWRSQGLVHGAEKPAHGRKTQPQIRVEPYCSHGALLPAHARLLLRLRLHFERVGLHRLTPSRCTGKLRSAWALRALRQSWTAINLACDFGRTDRPSAAGARAPASINSKTSSAAHRAERLRLNRHEPNHLPRVPPGAAYAAALFAGQDLALASASVAYSALLGRVAAAARLDRARGAAPVPKRHSALKKSRRT